MTRDEILRRRLNLLRWLDESLAGADAEDAFDLIVEIRELLGDIEHAMDTQSEREMEERENAKVPQEAR